ncbi:MAG TPA: S49 family peptidase, partial [Thermomicrobiales bacterium]|nr:S49 family peptidase [Thermomicrobiales bacterium]
MVGGFPLPIAERFLDLGVAHVDEYFGPWAVLLDPFRAAVERINRLDLRLHVDQARAGQAGQMGQARAAETRYGYDVAPGGVAVIHLTGPLMKYVSSLSGGSSTAIARRQLRNAVNDDAVASILLRIDSPGGTVSGTADLGDDVARAAKLKPTVAYIEDLGASAAYWIASQARQVFAGRTAIVGSIGAYTVLEDSSAKAEQAGVKIRVVRAGEMKGQGVEGTEITPELLAEVQGLIDALNEHFLRAVAAGRKMTLAK